MIVGIVIFIPLYCPDVLNSTWLNTELKKSEFVNKLPTSHLDDQTTEYPIPQKIESNRVRSIVLFCFLIWNAINKGKPKVIKGAVSKSKKLVKPPSTKKRGAIANFSSLHLFFRIKYIIPRNAI